MECSPLTTLRRASVSIRNDCRVRFSASPVAADGKLYLASEDGDVFVVKAGRKFELLATNPMGQALMATPAISAGMLIVRAENTTFTRSASALQAAYAGCSLSNEQETARTLVLSRLTAAMLREQNLG